jgi:dihydrofolate synthase / folylpolyglutamate synthase
VSDLPPIPATSAFDRANEALLARGPGRMIPDLSRITALAELLGDPQLAYPSVHVTGTNGKGSVVRMVGALCSAAGLAAGTYTSPHLQSVRERLSLAGRHISADRFAELHAEVAALADLLDARARDADGQAADHVTFFELLTAMAYAWFADVPVDVGVFEVGMGGRWDATNLVRGDVAVINTVDLDHSQLGDTPVAVAGEKVGIIKPDAHVISAEQQPDVLAVIERAVDGAAATLWRLGTELEVVDRRVAVGGQLVALRVGERVIDDILLPVFGAHQAANAALALGAFAALTGEAFAAMDDDVVRHGLGAVVIPGRLEIVKRDPTVVLDGAHNPHGARAVAAALDESFGFRELVLVAACLDDKDVVGILTELRDVASHVVVTQAPSDRAAPLERMRAAADAVWAGTGRIVEVAADLDTALDLAESVVGEGDGILVAGSLLTVGAARDRYLPLVDDAELGPEDALVLPPEEDDLPLRHGDGLDDLEAIDRFGDAAIEAMLAEDRAVDAAIEELLERDATSAPEDDERP